MNFYHTIFAVFLAGLLITLPLHGSAYSDKKSSLMDKKSSLMDKMTIKGHSSYLDENGHLHIKGYVNQHGKNLKDFVEITAKLYNHDGKKIVTYISFKDLRLEDSKRTLNFDLVIEDSKLAKQVSDYKLTFKWIKKLPKVIMETLTLTDGHYEKYVYHKKAIAAYVYPEDTTTGDENTNNKSSIDNSQSVADIIENNLDLDYQTIPEQQVNEIVEENEQFNSIPNSPNTLIDNSQSVADIIENNLDLDYQTIPEQQVNEIVEENEQFNSIPNSPNTLIDNK